MASYKAQQSADLGKDVVADQIEEEYIEQSPDNDSISNTKQAPQSSESKKVMPASFMEQDKEDYTGRCEVSAIQQFSDNEDDERKTTRKGKKRKTIASEKLEVASSYEEVNTEIESSHSERKRTKTTAELELSDNEVDRGIVRKRRQRSTNMSTKSSEKSRKRKKLVEVDNESSSNEEISPEICLSSSIMMSQCISDVDSIKHQSFSDMDVTSNIQSSGMTTGSQTSGPGQDNKPDLLNLMTLSTSEGDINIIQKTALHYREIGTYLLEDRGGEKVGIIKHDRKTAVAIMTEIYTQWIAMDHSWAKLTECFRKCTCDLHSLASIIERHFEPPSPTEIHSQSKVMTSQVSSDEESDDSQVCNEVSVFKMFFGKLCCVIKKPVEIAAEFQMKGVISNSVMSKLLTSPHSKQEKTIQLIRAVNKRIQSDPNRVYSFIGILCSVGFEEPGRQMWGEIGKKCMV